MTNRKTSVHRIKTSKLGSATIQCGLSSLIPSLPDLFQRTQEKRGGIEKDRKDWGRGYGLSMSGSLHNNIMVHARVVMCMLAVYVPT